MYTQMKLFLYKDTGKHLTQAPHYPASSVEEDDASPGAGGLCLGLEQPHRDGPKIQVNRCNSSILFGSCKALQKLEKSGHGADSQPLKYMPLSGVRERKGDIRSSQVPPGSSMIPDTCNYGDVFAVSHVSHPDTARQEGQAQSGLCPHRRLGFRISSQMILVQEWYEFAKELDCV